MLGCLLAGAVGDALGAPVEFLHWSGIRSQFGEAGIRDFVPAYGQLGAISDHTQMMLFTAEGLLRAHVRGIAKGICHPTSVIHHALLRWLLTQSERAASRLAGMAGYSMIVACGHAVCRASLACLHCLPVVISASWQTTTAKAAVE